MSYVENLVAGYKATRARIDGAAVKSMPQTLVRTYAIPNTPYLSPKLKPIYDCGWREAEISYNDAWALEIMGADVYVPTLRANIESIQRAVCQYFNVSKVDLLSPRRFLNLVKPRAVAMYLCKALTLKSFPEIGRHFGGRDHTTVLHAVRKIERQIKGNAELAGIVSQLKSRFESAA